jgi:hypothetical protein
MGTELPTKVMLGQTLVLVQMTFLNNARKLGRLVLSRTSCSILQSLSDLWNIISSILHTANILPSSFIELNFRIFYSIYVTYATSKTIE